MVSNAIWSIANSLVPEHLTDEQFWQRYLFHKHNIEAEERKRKLLLQGRLSGTSGADTSATQEQPEDFNWDDEEDPTSPTVAKPAAAERKPKVETDEKASPAQQPQPKAVATSTSTSPRDSEESYDLVSDQGKEKAAPPADDDDSDWE